MSAEDIAGARDMLARAWDKSEPLTVAERDRLVASATAYSVLALLDTLAPPEVDKPAAPEPPFLAPDGDGNLAIPLRVQE